jgi:Na+/H+ antiporter NhaD/arsenite permease-like protein
MILEIILTILFLIAFILIAFEEGLKMNKAKSTLFLGTFVWIILFLFAPSFGGAHFIEEAFEETILEIAILWLFLIAAMTFVAYMDRQGFIENIVYKYLPDKITEKKLLLFIGIFTFFFSSLADNLTATLVAITILIALNIEPKKLITYCVFVIFAANAGGVAMITGDVTTLMIFNAGKVEIVPLLSLFLPSFLALMVLYLLISRSVTGVMNIEKKNRKISKHDLIIGAIFISTIISVIAGHVLFHIPAMLTFLFGMSVMLMYGWIVIMKQKRDELELLEYIRAIEFDALFFFLGVLMLVGMLSAIGILGKAAILYDVIPVYFANYIIGILSSVVDNIPLTAAMLKAGIVMVPGDWLAMTYAVGVGGSLLVIGSAAGVVAMSKIKALTFGVYLKSFGYIFIAYSVGYVAAYFMGHLVA